MCGQGEKTDVIVNGSVCLRGGADQHKKRFTPYEGATDIIHSIFPIANAVRFAAALPFFVPKGK